MSGGLMELARASWWHSTFLRTAGAKIGRGVYFDTMSFSVSTRPCSGPVLNSTESLAMLLLGHCSESIRHLV